MAAKEGLLGKNTLCFSCRQSVPKQFCVCDIGKAVLCDACIPIHLKGDSRQPHVLLPLEYYDDSQDLSFFKKLMTLTQGKMVLERQVSEVLEWKNHFTAESERFQRKCRGFQEKVEASFDALHHSLIVSVDSGIEEVKAHIREPAPSLRNPIAREFWAPQENIELLREISDISVVFKAMEKQIDDSKAVFEVKCPNLIEKFRADQFVLLRGKGDAEEYSKNTE